VHKIKKVSRKGAKPAKNPIDFNYFAVNYFVDKNSISFF